MSLNEDDFFLSQWTSKMMQMLRHKTLDTIVYRWLRQEWVCGSCRYKSHLFSARSVR